MQLGWFVSSIRQAEDGTWVDIKVRTEGSCILEGKIPVSFDGKTLEEGHLVGMRFVKMVLEDALEDLKLQIKGMEKEVGSDESNSPR